MTPPPSSCSRDMPVDLPVGVNQNGTNAGFISLDDAANLRDNLEA